MSSSTWGIVTNSGLALGGLLEIKSIKLIRETCEIKVREMRET